MKIAEKKKHFPVLIVNEIEFEQDFYNFRLFGGNVDSTLKIKMAAFVAKQMMGNKLSAVKGQIGGESENQEDKNEAEQAEQERLEALREAEERRKEKHRKMEEEREKMRQEIRDKYGIKKKEEKEAEMNQAIAASSLNRRKKTPAELAAEQEAEEQDDFTKLKNTLETQVNELKTTIEGKCLLQ